MIKFYYFDKLSKPVFQYILGRRNSDFIPRKGDLIELLEHGIKGEVTQVTINYKKYPDEKFANIDSIDIIYI